MRLTLRLLAGPVQFALAVLLAAAAPVAAQTETIEYYGTDAVGSVRIVFTASGTVLGRQDYDPFGREILSAWGVPPERFGGQSADGEVQQAYFHARQFQSRTGRFATVDPLFDVEDDPQRLNRYNYGLGNPLRYADVFGADPSEPFNPCVDSSSPDCLSDDPFLPGFGGGDDDICPLFHGGLCGEQPPKNPRGGKPTTTPTTDPPKNDPPKRDPPKNDPPKPTTTMSPEKMDWDYWYKNVCVTSALETAALNVGIDSIGFIPEAGGLARTLGHASGHRGVVADQLGHRAIEAVRKTAAVENSAIGLDASDWASYGSAAITIGDFVPGVNEFTTLIALGWDTGLAAYKVYQCPK